MFNFIFGATVIYFGFQLIKQLIKHKKIGTVIKTPETRNTLAIIAMIVVSSAIFISLFIGFYTFLNFLKSPFWFMQTKVAALENFWPNVLVTVAEFNPGSLGTIIDQMGGKLLFFLGMMGVVFIMLPKEDKIPKAQKYILGFGAIIYLFLVSKYGTALSPITFMVLLALPVIIGMLVLLKSDQEVDVKLAIFLVIWFVATSYAALKGVRFTLLMVSAFGVAFGITISSLYRIVSRWISIELKINEMITKTVVAVLLLLILISPVKAGYYVAANYIPSVNDAWYDSLTKIKDNSQQDAIINSWWDFGHWFKYIADRRVTLDGSSQGGPPLHWLGKLMVTDNEKQSVGILRMLDCGSNTAFDELNKILNDTSKSIEILDKIVTLDKEKAQDLLVENGLTKKEAENVLKYTHCEPPEDFFITSEDMVGKAGVWAHFGSWDFKRAEIYSRVKGKMLEEARKIMAEKEYNLTEEQADQYYYEIQTQDDSQWISPWPGYLSGVQNCEMPNSEGVMVCTLQASNNQILPLIINLTNMDARISAKEEYKPSSIVYVTPTGTEERKFSGNTLEFSVVLVPRGEEGYSALITHPYLANSIFTRLFYLNGHGLKYFDKFDDQTGITGGRIIVWKVDWEGKDANNAYKAIEPNAEDTNVTKAPAEKTKNPAKNVSTDASANEQ
jgi:dolichyl-diphosphooligosaccharide--protein glycosyltransferase